MSGAVTKCGNIKKKTSMCMFTLSKYSIGIHKKQYCTGGIAPVFLFFRKGDIKAAWQQRGPFAKQPVMQPGCVFSFHIPVMRARRGEIPKLKSL